MNKHCNIYDIDGNIIFDYNNPHKMTLEEAQEKVRYYQEKLKPLLEIENPTKEDKKRISTYQIYMHNLLDYEWELMKNAKPEELQNILSKNSSKTDSENTKKQVEKALTELKNDIETGKNIEDAVPGSVTDNTENTDNEKPGDDGAGERTESSVQERRPVTQSDLLVERDGINTVMDEYVEYTES